MWPRSRTSHTSAPSDCHDPHDPAPAAVPDAVGGELAGGQHQVLLTLACQAGATGAVLHEPAHLDERVELEAEQPRRGGRRRERRVERLQQARRLAVGATRRPVDERVAAARLVDDGLVERRHVVGTQQPEVARVGEREIEQRLVELALDQLGRAASGPDRLADAADRAGVGAREVAPGGDDPRRVVAQHGHVDELDAAGVGADLAAQRGDALRTDRDEHRLASGKPFAEEGHGAGEEAVGAVVQQCFVAEHQGGRCPA